MKDLFTKKFPLFIIALLLALTYSGMAYALTPNGLPPQNISLFHRSFDLWRVDTQIEFEQGVLNNVDTSSSPGDVKLASPSNWYDESWSSRALVTISNTGSALTDYQVRVDVTYDADMQPDFDDLRFTDNNGTTLLPHWRESYIASASAVFWVKVPSIPAGNSTIYMYYGNTDVNSASDGDNTFEFFDEGDQISSWTTGTVGTGSAGQSSTIGNPAPSYYVNSPSASSYAWMKRDIGLTTNKIIEFDMQTDTSLGQYYVLDVPFLVSTGGYGQHFRLESRAGEKSGFAWKNNWTAFNWGAPTSGSAYSVGTWYKAKIEIGSTQANGWIGGAYQPTSPYALRTTAGNTFIGIEWSGRIDNIRVRKYTSPEPTTSVGVEEGLYVSSGTIASKVYDTWEDGARCDLLGWDETLPSGAAITFEVRAQNASFDKNDITPLWQNASAIPIAGQYQQWRATLTSNSVETPVLQEVWALYSW